MHSIIQINELSKTPKYKQIVQSILTGIETGKLKQNDKLPSINHLLTIFDISRDTVVKAYDQLKEMEIIESAPGKGYYVTQATIESRPRIFLLFNKLSAHKKIIYDALAQTLGDQASIDFFIYHNKYRLFKELVLSNKDKPYTHFVIIAHFLDGGIDAADVINQIPKEKLILLDKKVKGIDGDYAAIYQDFSRNIYDALVESLGLLDKYEQIKIIFPPYTYHPGEIIEGFQSFCSEYAFQYGIARDIKTEPIEKGDVFINLMEDDLVTLIKRIKHQGLSAGKDVGIISYNDTPLKEILLDGITVISTDFKQLGVTTGRMILEQKPEHVSNPFYVIRRASL